ncbi:MAG: glycosyltransferase [Clostridium sp.]|nr:glycosyltransferase [Clostridium sp.]MCM1444672.1 glycosyltransferase [Candidatus Amulumruptor caecigallinarius]
MVKVSIIVPVYNVEKYLDKCLNSLINQTLRDIEIIIVNDGTKDNSQVIIDKYVEKDKRIKSYIKENGGLSDARNYGMKYAIGEYIGFVDSDDYVENDMFEKMYNKAVSNNFDIVTCDLNYVYDKKIKRCSCNINNDLLNKEDIKKNMIYIYPTAWNKIYKKSKFSHFDFKKGVWYEDVEFMYRILPYISSIGVVHETLYQYVQRPGAISKTYNNKIYDTISNWNGLIEYYKTNDLYDIYYNELEFCYVRYLYANFIKGLLKIRNYEEFICGVNLSIKNVNSNFPNYKKNKYINKFSIKNIYLKYFNKKVAILMYKLKILSK